MTYKDIFLNFKGLYTKHMAALDQLMTEGVPKDSNLNELVLSVALCDSTADIRNTAKKVIKKHGTLEVKKALTLLSRRNYYSDSGNENLKEDLSELEKLEGFHTARFAKYLFIRNNRLDNARDYFFKYATDDELKFYFVNDSYRSSEGDDLWLYPGGEIDGRVAQILWDSIPEVADRVTYISCNTDETFSINLKGIELPNLYELSLHTKLDSFPAEVFDISSIHKLGISVTMNTFPEGLGKMKNLRRLYFSSPVSELPEDIFTLENLDWLTIESTKLKAIPESIGKLKNLKNIGIDNNPELNIIPRSLFDLPNLPEVYKKMIRAEFMPANEYEVLFNEFEYVLRWFKDIPSVQEQVNLYKTGEPNFMPELILAASRCYYDDEHGLKMTDLYTPIDQIAPESLQLVNKTIKKPKFIDERVGEEELDKIRQKVSVFRGFHADIFMQFIAEMVKYVNTKYPFEKW